MPRPANPNRPKYAKVIADTRKEKELSQSFLGHLIGRDAASIKKYESGAVIPPFFVLLDIAFELNINRYELVDMVVEEISDPDQWIQDAFEDIEWSFGQTSILITSLHRPERFMIQYEDKETIFPKIDFLFKVSEIMRFARKQYNDTVLTKTGHLTLDILNGDVTQDNIHNYIVNKEEFFH